VQIKVFILEAEQKGNSEVKAVAARLMGLYKLGVWMPAAGLGLDGWKQG